MIDQVLKKCSKCGEMKPATSEHFFKQKNQRDGWQAYCRPCKALIKRQWRGSGSPAARAERTSSNLSSMASARRLKETDPDEWGRRQAEKRRRDAPLQKQWHRQRSADPEYRAQALDRVRQWREANPDRTKEQRRNRKARLRGSAERHTAADVRKALEAQRHHCWWCSEKLINYHVDHLIPLARGGSNAASNIVIACPQCNMRRRHKMPWEADSPRLI